eukprot:TRINITY_DN15603_c0_g1_i1.p1 TRINITY_DN15603_c0_g1~~TRINITY_DN15603_c0_g1_i1.p1  ORF type:complete len:321 (+),score=55.55 TRINITY_DN15603_c0_g1_i1:66-965(+)
MATNDLSSVFAKQSGVGSVAISDWKGLPAVVVTFKSSSCTILLHGATVVSWVCAGTERIFVSQKAFYEPPKAVRGGIPICFPQFGPGALPQHGFARNKPWKIASTMLDTDAASVCVELANDADTEKVWPHSFTVRLTVSLDSEDHLDMRFVVHNTGNTEFTFTGALHTYFRITDALQSAVYGLHNLQYVDKTDGLKTKVQHLEQVRIEAETDRVYMLAPNSGVALSDDVQRTRLIVDKTGFPDVVVWNPFAEKVKSIADMGQDEWTQFVCVEVAAASSPQPVAPGQSWHGSQTLQIARL